MPETLILPLLARLLPGALTYWPGRKVHGIWPGMILASDAIAWGGWRVCRSAGAAAADAAAVTRTMAAFTLAAPAAMSELVGMAFARFHTARAG